MGIFIQYGPHVGNAPAGFQTAVNAALRFLDHAFGLFNQDITINVDFGYVDGQAIGVGPLAESEANANSFSYA